MRREFKVEVNQGQPQVEYKEALTQVANHREVYKNNLVVEVSSQISYSKLVLQTKVKLV
jgi:translation elongation factor EF-G